MYADGGVSAGVESDAYWDSEDLGQQLPESQTVQGRSHVQHAASAECQDSRGKTSGLEI